MLSRVCHGQLPSKPHTALRAADGRLRYEECITRRGFDGPYTIAYHERRPHEALPQSSGGGWPSTRSEAPGLVRRHFRSGLLPGRGGAPHEERVVLLENEDLSLGVLRPVRSDERYFVNADADDLYFVHQGSGVLRSALGDLRYRDLDYLGVPRGLLHRFVLDAGVEHRLLAIECRGGIGIPKQYRNDVGQLKMEAPYTHRDFRAPEFVGPLDEGIRSSLVKKGGAFFGFVHTASPLDVVGWDGTLYPWAFSILDFSPKVGHVHLPPTVHATFALGGALVCSFVPRPLDFHPQAVPCPYPHSSVDIDEVIYYVSGSFTSRTDVGPGSISLHPAGIPHGPHPGAYEASIGATHTDELAVMLDCQRPLHVAHGALAIEDPAYHQSFVDPGSSQTTG